VADFVSLLAPGPAVLCGFASTLLLNMSVTTTIDTSTGGFASVSSGPIPFFANIQGYNIDASTGALTLGSASFVEDGVLWLTTVQLPSSAVQEKRDRPFPSRRLY
jgi:hypothetical protein